MSEIVVMRQREGKPGGGKGPMLGDKSFTLATANDQTLFIFTDDRRTGPRFEDGIVPTLQSFMGTGGGNVPITVYSIREDAKANTFSATELEVTNALQALQPSVQSHHAQSFVVQEVMVRRLTPTECERLQGFPDGWTEGQKDLHRYKQMGNAVAVPVVNWILNNLTKTKAQKNV